METTVRPRLSDPIPNSEAEFYKSKGDEEYSLYLLRTNHQRIKPNTKYAEEGVRPKSPNVQYTLMTDETKEKIKKNSLPFYHNCTRTLSEVEKKPRHFVEKHVDVINQHLIRGPSHTQPYCYVTKEAHNQIPPEEFQASQLGAYPTWGPANTGYRTRSHYVGEPVERYTNIDLYRRPPTNQPGQIIFDYGRPNNGYYLQRNQYENTWFDTKLKLNRTDILKSIDQKTKSQYDYINEVNKLNTRSKSAIWPHISEYEDRFVGKPTSKEFENSLK